MFEALWAPYVGPRGGQGWKNLKTGRVRYGSKPLSVAKPPKASVDDVAKDIRILQTTNPKDVQAALTDLGQKMGTLKVKELHALKAQLGIKASAPTKQALAEKLVQRATGYGAEGLPLGKAMQDRYLPAKVEISPQELSQVQGFLGKKVDAGQLGAMVNGHPGVKLDITYPRGKMQVIHEDPDHGTFATREFGKDSQGKLYVHNEAFSIADTSPSKGQGAVYFTNQVQALRSAGVSYITTQATGEKGSHYNGYYTWARFGYDGKIPGESWDKLPADLKAKMGAKRNVQSLMALPGGKEAWKEHGSTFDGTFDLSDGSASMKALESYLRERKGKKNAG